MTNPEQAVTPSTRGWTLTVIVLSLDRRWLPRPRGDGPYETTTGDCRTLVTPPTRGWTLEYICFNYLFGGYPAHAGMDLVHRSGHRRYSRLPRPRGDGPP